jgi:hypothetical protein
MFMGPIVTGEKVTTEMFQVGLNVTVDETWVDITPRHQPKVGTPLFWSAGPLIHHQKFVLLNMFISV